MKLLYGTQNAGKLAAMKRSLSSLKEIQLIDLGQMEGPVPEAAETGSSPLENARIKARAYYETWKQPVFSCDTGMYLQGLPQELQPGVHVRNVNGRCLRDREMTAYYSGLARKYGDLTAHYQNAICLILDETHIYESMAGNLSGEPFLLTQKAHPRREPGFPLDCLSKKLATGQYYYDMKENQADDVALDRGFCEFFQMVLKEQRI